MNVAENLVTALADHGVTTVWGVVGDALNPVTDAIRREDRIEWIGVRHEEAAAFAAGAQAQLTGTIGVCMGTVGPGLDPPAERALRREEVARAGAGDLRPGADGGDGHRVLPGGQQRRPPSATCPSSPTRSPPPRRCRRSWSRRSTPRTRSRVSPCSPSPATSAIWSSQDDTAPRFAPRPAEAAAPVVPDPRRRRSVLADADAVTLLVGLGARHLAASRCSHLAERLQAPTVLTLKAKEGSGAGQSLRRRAVRTASATRPPRRRSTTADVLFLVGTDFPYREWLPKGKTVHPAGRARRAHRAADQRRARAGGSRRADAGRPAPPAARTSSPSGQASREDRPRTSTASGATRSTG